MTDRTILTALALALVLGAGTARADEGAVAVDAAKDTEIRALLTEQGYEVRSVAQLEDGRYEAYAVKDGEMLEVILDADLAILEIEEDGEEDEEEVEG